MNQNTRTGARRTAVALMAGLALGVVTALIVSSGIAAAGGLFGHRGWHHRGEGHERFDAEHVGRALDHGLRWLDTSDVQNDQIRSLVLARTEEFRELHAQHRAQREALVAWFASDDLAPERLAEIRARSLELAGETARELEGMMLELAPVLSSEQRRELIEDLARFRHH